MKKNAFFNLILLALTFGLVFSACKKDDPATPAITGEALFTYVTDGLNVTFTNTSTVSGTYAWDFGDNATSTDKDPVHAYASKGEYICKLTVTDSDGGTHDATTKITVDKSSPVVLDDGNFDDWSTIAEAMTYDVANTGVIKSFKYDFDSDNIYFYIKQDVTFTEASIFDMLIDTNPSDTTGYKYPVRWPLYTGGELLIENSFSNTKDNEDLYWMDFAPFHPEGTDWDTYWVYDEGNTADAQSDGTYLVTGSTVEIEFSISRKNIPALVGKDVIKIAAWTSDQEWEEIGWMPAMSTVDAPDTDGLIIDMQ